MTQGQSSPLLKRLKDNDKQLIRELSDLSCAIAEKMALPAYVMPEDIAQDVFVALLSAIESGRFRGESSIRTFAHSITVRTCLNKARELKRAAEGDPDLFPDPDADTERALLTGDRRRVARQIVASLPESCRRLWALLFVEELNYRQAAERLNVKEVTVRERMHSCCKRARQLVASFEATTKRG